MNSQPLKFPNDISDISYTSDISDASYTSDTSYTSNTFYISDKSYTSDTSKCYFGFSFFSAKRIQPCWYELLRINVQLFHKYFLQFCCECFEY